MATVIIGGGIIGTSIAYYLSHSVSGSKEADVHVIDSSSQLYSGASGYAAGFVAKDWFEPAVAELGALSFELHRQLAEEHDGPKRWGYMQGTAWSFDGTTPERKAEDSTKEDNAESGIRPGWLTTGSVEAISDKGVAQVDPLRLCQFLHGASVSQGVTWHHPAQPIDVVSDPVTHLICSVKVLNSETQTEYNIPSRNVVICAGPWTSLVYKSLFPSATARPPSVSALAGYSLVLRSPRHTLEHEQGQYQGKSHAVFATEDPQGRFSPEIFSRQGAEIYIAGLNDRRLALPMRAEGAKSLIDSSKINILKQTAGRLMGDSLDKSKEDDGDLEVLREGLCFRPISATGRPIISRVSEEYLGRKVRSNHSGVGRDIGGVFLATGHGPWGISHSLGTGRVVADLVDGVEPAADISGLGIYSVRSVVVPGSCDWRSWPRHQNAFPASPKSLIVPHLFNSRAHHKYSTIICPSLRRIFSLMADLMGEDGYDDSNRAFLQAFMARSTMTFEEAKPVLAAISSVREGREILQEDITQADLNSYIAAANSAISPFDLEIRSAKRQTINGDGQNANPFIYALVNTTSDPLTQLATTYTADEIAFVKRLLDAMFETYNTRRCEALVVSSMQALQLAKAPVDPNRRESAAVQANNGNNTTTTQGGAAHSLSMTQAETMLSSLVDEGWLEKSAKGYYSLSARGLMELRGWLVETYNDEDEEGHRAQRVKFCAACKDILTVGQRCADRYCPGRLHDACIRNFFRLQQSERCPVCKIQWPGDQFVGERAITSTQARRPNHRMDGQAGSES